MIAIAEARRCAEADCSEPATLTIQCGKDVEVLSGIFPGINRV